MHWTVVAKYEPSFSPRKRLQFALWIVVIVLIKCIFEYFENGVTKSFQLLAALAITSALLEWKNFSKPREVQLQIEDGRLSFTNLYTREKHTVYQSRTEWIKQEGGYLIFYSANSFATRIPLYFFHPDDQRQLLDYINSWNKKIV
jgi:hypothetical protein